jgi:preprotein translocase subunit SecG
MDLIFIMVPALIMPVVAVLFTLCAIILVLAVLIQKGKGGGLGAAFGGAAGSLLGAKSKEPMTYITIALACLFLLLAVVLAKFWKPTLEEKQAPQPPAGQRMPATQPAMQPIEEFPVDEIDNEAGQIPDINEDIMQ